MSNAGVHSSSIHFPILLSPTFMLPTKKKRKEKIEALIS